MPATPKTGATTFEASEEEPCTEERVNNHGQDAAEKSSERRKEQPEK